MWLSLCANTWKLPRLDYNEADVMELEAQDKSILYWSHEERDCVTAAA